MRTFLLTPVLCFLTSVFVLCSLTSANAGLDTLADVVDQAPAPALAESYYKESEFNVSLLASGDWTQSEFKTDRYLGVDHALGGSLDGKLFFKKYFGVGLRLSGYDVNNPAITGERKFVGNVMPTITFRYPLKDSPLAPYAFVGFGVLFNGGIKGVEEPGGSIGNRIRFEKAEHDAEMITEFGAGAEYRIKGTPIGVIAEAAFDDVTRPQANSYTFRVGANVHF